MFQPHLLVPLQIHQNDKHLTEEHKKILSTTINNYYNSEKDLSIDRHGTIDTGINPSNLTVGKTR